MKKLVGILIILVVLYCVYIDLTVGTLPNTNTEKVQAEGKTPALPAKGMPYFEAKVKPGDTVISIIEHNLNKALPVSITDLIDDFRQLNPGQSPEKIQIGVLYKFPDYHKK